MVSVKILFSLVESSLNIILGLVFFYLIRVFFDIQIIGYFGTIMSFLMALSFIFDLGFGIAHLKYYSEAKNSEEQAICNGTFLFLRLIQFSIYIIIMFILIRIIPIYTGDIKVVYIMLLANLFIIVPSYLFQFFFLAQKNVVKMSLTLIVSSLMKTLVLITFNSIVILDIWFLIYIVLASNVISIITGIILLKNIRFKKPTYEYRRKYLKYSFPFLVISTFSIIAANIDVLLVNSWFSIAEVANYYTAKNIYIYLGIFEASVSFILITSFSKNSFLGNNKKNLMNLSKIQKFFNILIVPLIFIVILYFNRIIILIFGENYGQVGLILSILSINIITISIDLGNGPLLNALGEINFFAKFSVFQYILSIILMVIFISPEFLDMGAMGGALALVFTNILSQLIIRPIYFRKFRITFYWGAFRNVAIMVGIFILQFFINEIYSYSIYLMPLFMLFDVTLYFSINYVLKGFSIEDIKFMLKIFSIKNIKESFLLEFKNKNLDMIE